MTRALVLFHGIPGSRLFVPGPVPDAVELITFDRPGYGDEPPQTGRTVLDTAAQVRALLDARGIERAALVGWSGGCPFAAATAYALGPSRIDALALVSGPGPLDEVPGGWESLGNTFWLPTAKLIRAGRLEEATANVVEIAAPYNADPTNRILGSGKGPDGPVLRDPHFRPMLEAQIVEAVKQGAYGHAGDFVAMFQPWGFALADLAVPTHVFIGALDRSNQEDARVYAANVPGATLTTWDGAGHLGICLHWAEVVAAVVGEPTG